VNSASLLAEIVPGPPSAEIVLSTLLHENTEIKPTNARVRRVVLANIWIIFLSPIYFEKKAVLQNKYNYQGHEKSRTLVLPA